MDKIMVATFSLQSHRASVTDFHDCLTAYHLFTDQEVTFTSARSVTRHRISDSSRLNHLKLVAHFLQVCLQY